MEAPEGWAPRRGPNFALFFPLPLPFSLFFSLWGSFRGILVVFEASRPEMCTFGVLGLSCEAPTWCLRRGLRSPCEAPSPLEAPSKRLRSPLQSPLKAPLRPFDPSTLHPSSPPFSSSPTPTPTRHPPCPGRPHHSFLGESLGLLAVSWGLRGGGGR